MVAETFYTDAVQVDATDFRGRNNEPCLQLAIVQMNILQLLYLVKTAQALSVTHY